MQNQTFSLGSKFKNWITHPLAKGVDVDSPDRVRVHRAIIDSKPILQAHLNNWYQELLPAERETRNLPGSVVEIGSGAGFLERLIPEVIKTDIVETPFVSRVEDACSLTFQNKSVRALFATGVFHHMKEPAKFLNEAERVLVNGGRLVLVEPHNTFPQKILCKALDHWEYFDDKITSWDSQESDVMTHANLALPWVVFVRDAEIFHKRFPTLRIKAIRYHSLFIHLLSGGTSFKPFVPNYTVPLWQTIEKLMSPMMKLMGTSMTIDIEKIEQAPS